MKSPLNIKEKAYEKQNRKMRKDYTKETGKTLGSRQTSGTGKRRVSFACRFAGMAGAMKDAKGEPTKKAMALKKWGFGSVAAAKTFGYFTCVFLKCKSQNADFLVCNCIKKASHNFLGKPRPVRNM